MNTAALPHSVGARPLQVTIVTHADELRALAPAWQELLDDSPAAQPTCAPSWLMTWWDVYGRQRQLCTGVFRDGDRLVGIAPLCRRTYWHRPGIPFRRIELLGSDVDEDDGVCSEYLNLVSRHGFEERVADGVARALEAGAFGRFDECVFCGMDEPGPLRSALARFATQRGHVVEQTQTARSHYAPLPHSWEEFTRPFTKKKRQSLTYALRDFHQWAGDQWSLTVAQSSADLDRGLEILIDLHHRRWQAVGHDGAFASSRFQAFHRQFARLALDQGQLLLMWITVRNAPVAALYGFIADDKVYFYQCGRTLDVPGKVRLGIVQVIFAMQHAMERGLREFDFLAGDAQYKQLFATGERPIYELRLARSGPREWLRRLARTTLGLGRTVRRGAESLTTMVQRLSAPKSRRNPAVLTSVSAKCK